jgi:hypothetical protein
MFIDEIDHVNEISNLDEIIHLAIMTWMELTKRLKLTFINWEAKMKHLFPSTHHIHP